MGIITAETFYPAEHTYTTAKSMISDLGATEPPNSLITQPSATIFNLSMIITGILVLTGSIFIYRSFNDKIAAILVGLLGLGALGVGIFPGNINPQHPLFAMTTFISGGLSAIYSYRLINSPLKYPALLFGIFTSVFPVYKWYFHTCNGWGWGRKMGCIPCDNLVNCIWRIFNGLGHSDKG